MSSITSIYNRALQKLGAERVVDIDENSSNARACTAVYSELRDAELRSHPWSFCIQRVSLAEDAVAPAFGKACSFQLPSDFLCLREDDFNSLSKDWIIEGRKILTDEGGPLNIRYNSQVTDPNIMDPLFREALSTIMALEMCEEITQSNSKKEGLKDDYKLIINKAKKANAIERIALQPPEDIWVTIRN